MPRTAAPPRLILYGPDKKYGARQKKGWKEYVWYICWHDGEPRERSTGFGRSERSEAEKALAQFLLTYEPASAEGPLSADQMPIADCLRLYAEGMDEKDAEPETPVDVVRIGHAIVALIGFFGDKKVSAVNAASCDDYVKARQNIVAGMDTGVNCLGRRKRRSRPSKPSTSRRDLSVLRAAMNWCVRKSKLKAAQPMELPKNDDGKKPFLRRNEAAELLLAARREPRVRDYLPDFILFGIYHGARKGAELDVQWYPNDEAGHVDLRQYRIDFNGNRPVTKKCRPLAVVSNRLRCFLPHWRKKRRRYVIERNGEKLADIKRGFKSVCLEAAKVFERLAAAAERQGDYIAMHEHLESVARLKIATPHILRHTCITWLLQAGFSCWEVGKFVGDRAATIEKTYGHHCSKYQASLANAFSRNGVARPKPLLVVMEEAA